jgi:integrative and conjugative element protein (TIGR02256 family)
LLGYIAGNRRAIVTRATPAGPKAIRSATRFHRDTTFAQTEIDRAASELGDKGVYIGEWHSHLEPAPEPSPTDVRSLTGIAAASNYLTNNPIMLIVGYDPAVKKAIAINSWVFIAAGRFYRISNVASDK